MHPHAYFGAYRPLPPSSPLGSWPPAPPRLPCCLKLPRATASPTHALWQAAQLTALLRLLLRESRSRAKLSHPWGTRRSGGEDHTRAWARAVLLPACAQCLHAACTTRQARFLHSWLDFARVARFCSGGSCQPAWLAYRLPFWVCLQVDSGSEDAQHGAGG